MGTPFDLGKSQCHISRTAKNDPKTSDIFKIMEELLENISLLENCARIRQRNDSISQLGKLKNCIAVRLFGMKTGC